MKKNNKKDVDWNFWWEQVLNGTIPESVYRKARMKDKYRKRNKKALIELEKVKKILEK